MRGLLAMATVGLMLGACFSATLDTEASGVYACEADDDCPEGQLCLGDRCYAPDDEDVPDGTVPCTTDDECLDAQSCLFDRCHGVEPPEVQIVTPEDEQELMAGADMEASREVAVSLVIKNLDLVEAAEDPDAEVGKGQVRLIVDGEQAAIIDSGGTMVSRTVTITPRPGAHRISAVAVNSNGTRYGNPGSWTNRLFWVADEQPHVAIKQPWPGDEFPAEARDILVEVSAINFRFVPFDETAPGAFGHAHVHYDKNFPACIDDPMCIDAAYLPIQPPEAGRHISGMFTLPDDSERTVNLSATLQNNDHSLFVPMADGAAAVWDSIPIERVID